MKAFMIECVGSNYPYQNFVVVAETISDASREADAALATVGELKDLGSIHVRSIQAIGETADSWIASSRAIVQTHADNLALFGKTIRP